MTTRAAVLLGIVLGSFALMTVIGAVLTEGRSQGPLSLGDVLVPAAIPLLLVVAITVVCRTGSARRSRSDEKLVGHFREPQNPAP
ncbi:MAG: hypothetical protein WAM92_17440 [Mycobacterium sp.]